MAARNSYCRRYFATHVTPQSTVAIPQVAAEGTGREYLVNEREGKAGTRAALAS